MLHELNQSSVIIIHGMFNIFIVALLLICGLIKKSYWCIWGGDLYDYDKESGIFRLIKKNACKNLRGVITPFEGCMTKINLYEVRQNVRPKCPNLFSLTN